MPTEQSTITTITRADDVVNAESSGLLTTSDTITLFRDIGRADLADIMESALELEPERREDISLSLRSAVGIVWGHGMSDDSFGHVDTFGFYWRVGACIVGDIGTSCDMDVYDTERDAATAWEQLADLYSRVPTGD